MMRPLYQLPRLSLARQNLASRSTFGLHHRIKHQARFVFLEAGEDKTGHIKENSNQAIYYFDNVYPLRLAWLLAIPWQTEKTLPDLIDRVQSPSLTRTNPLNIIKNAKAEASELEVVPRIKEGGAFVKITLPPGASAGAIGDALKNYLREASIKPWWSPFIRMRANLVKGKPWVEDLYRLPSSRLKVEFLPTAPDRSAAELSQEQLYELFRPYGKLGDIVSQEPDSKITPKFAHLEFRGVRRAAMAKNCLHGLVIAESHGGGKTGTLLRITYEQKAKSNWIKDWIFSHPRIMIPIIAALVAGITVAIFDPIRTFFIKAHITHFFRVGDNRFVKWLRSQATDIFTFRKNNDAGMDVIWDDRRSNINQIQAWLAESNDTFIIVQGPRGSGKKDLVVDKALNKRKTLVIDCKPIQEARGDSSTINATASEVGYRPVFSFMNTLSGWIDLAAQGTTGVKTGFSETLEAQITKIFNNTATALKQTAVQQRSKRDSDAGLNDDEYLEAHPEERVVVVIDNFLHKSQESTVVYDKIAEWAAGLTTGNIAHVIFLTHDVSFSKSLSKALPDRVFRQMSLSDSSPQAAKRFVISKLDADADTSVDPNTSEKKLLPSQKRKDLAELDECIDIVGGRLTDLEFLARRIKMGETPRKAVREIVEQSASEILKMYLFNSDESSSGQRKWLSVQSWLLIKQLAASETASLRYNELILDDIFKSGATGGPDAVLQALEQAELISVVVSSNGRPHSIRPGKPVYQAAFQRLTDDRVLSSRLDLAIAGELIKIENGAIEKCEAELKILGDLPNQPYQVTPRVKWLLGKIAASQANVEKYEAQSGALKAIMKTEF